MGVTAHSAGCDTILLRPALREGLIRVCLEALPRKAYGLIGGPDVLHPRSVYPCVTNLRNTTDWAPIFGSFGTFYEDPDRGFVVTPEEYAAIVGKMARRGETVAGVFHSHRCRDAYPSELDLSMHFSPDVPAYIISVLCPNAPALKVYRIDQGGSVELAWVSAADDDL